MHEATANVLFDDTVLTWMMKDAVNSSVNLGSKLIPSPWSFLVVVCCCVGKIRGREWMELDVHSAASGFVRRKNSECVRGWTEPDCNSVSR